MRPTTFALKAATILALAASADISVAFAQGAPDGCGDASCPIPHDGALLTVCTPVPSASIEPVAQGARLDSLEGKTIAIVGGSFMANVTHPELKRLIKDEFPSAKVYLLSEIGSAGPYPRPGVVRREKDAFQRKLSEFKIDAVISGNGGCGLCTPKETGSCIAAEVMGIPSVMIAGPGFTREAKATARAAGIDVLRVAEYPGAFASDSRDTLLENTREVLWPAIKKALTEPISEAEAGSPDTRRTATDIETFDSLESFHQAFMDSGFTDGLPVMPPTLETVAEFLKFTDLPPTYSLGAIPPAQREATVAHVAVNGAMAGCPPEFMPVLLAFTEAMKDGDFRRTLASTHAWTPYCWLNGPVSRQLGFDHSQGEISEAKNMQIGRFINLAMLNLGGYRVKENRMGTFGYLMPWCLAEDEAAAVAIGWKPHHLQQGFGIDDSTLTAASAVNWGNNLVPATTDAEKIKDLIAWDAAEKSQMAVGSGMPCTYRVFLLTESVARDLARAYPSKDAFESALVESSRIPLGSRAFANYWGNPGSAFDPRTYPLARHESRIASNEGAQPTAMPPWLAWTGQDEAMTVPAMLEGKSAFLVTGDPARNKELCLPGGGFATVKIELPANWDELMAARGYAPLEKFRIVSDLQPDAPRPRIRPPSHSGARGDLRPQPGRRRMGGRVPSRD